MADSNFYADNVADALADYNALAAKLVAPEYDFTWQDGVKLHEAFEALQAARLAQGRYFAALASPAGWESVPGGVDNLVERHYRRAASLRSRPSGFTWRHFLAVSE